MRVNRSIERRRLLRERGASGSLPTGEGARHERPPARARLLRRRPLAHRPPARAARARAGGRGWRSEPSCTRSPTGATSRRTPRGATWPSSSTRASAIATVCGRYYAMDRDQRWDRTHRALAAIVAGEARTAEDPVAAIEASYDAGVTDEFVEPVVLAGRRGSGRGTPRSSSTSGRTAPASSRSCSSRRGFDLTTMTRYRDDFDCPVAFEEQEVAETMAEVLAEHGVRQLHVAETEKYAHVTYFFNGGREDEWEGETRILVPSPKDVATYDQKPEMSARRGHEPLRGGDRRRLPVRDRELREPGHGRPHRSHPRGRPRGRDGGRLPRARRRGGRARRRRLPRHGRSRQRGADARAGRHEPAHGAHDEPGPL